MQDFTQGFAMPEPQPTPTPLQPTDLMRFQTAGFGESGTGALLGTLANTNDYVAGVNPLTLQYGDSWGRDNTKAILTNNEFVNQSKLLQYMNSQGGDAATALGLAVDAKSALVLRQMLNRGPLSPVTYGDSELTPELLKADQDRIGEILHRHATVDYSANPALMEAEQQEARDIMGKLLYAQTREKVSQSVGFNWLDWFAASNTWWGGPNWVINKLGYDTTSIPKDNSDITGTLSRYDPNFDAASFFDTTFKDPIARQAMLERGITADYIASSPNADAAMFKISQAVNQSYIQQRLGTYKPTAVDTAIGLGSGLVDFMVDTPTGAVLAPLTLIGGVLELGGDLLAGAGVGIAEAVAGTEAAANTARVLTIGKNAMQLYKLPLGMAPEWLAGSTLIGHAGATGVALGAHGLLSEYERQKEEIAFGAASLYANPNVRLDIDQHEILMAGLNGLWQGALFGLGSGLLGSAVGAGKNRLLGVMGENGKRSATDFRWSLEGTQLGETIDLFSKRKRGLLDVTPADRVKIDSVLENKTPTPEGLAAEATGRAERVETHEAMVNPTAAEASPADVGARRYEGESVKSWINRVASNREVRNLPEIATEVARRTPVDATERRALDTTSTFAQMTPKEQIRTLLRTKDVIAEARQAEETSVGLPKERERVYDQLESQRKAWIRNLSKRLTPDEFKMLKQELENNKKPSALPDLLRLAKDNTKPLAERKAAASEAAAQLLETARTEVASKAPVTTTRTTVPAELLPQLNAVVKEHKLTGNISQTTAEKVKKSLLNPDRVEETTQDINRRVLRSLSTDRLDPERSRKIRAIGEDHTRFVELARGNKERAQRLADAVDELVDNGVMSSEDRTLLLSSLVHVNFDVKGFDINYKFEENTPDNPNTVGDWDRKTRTLTIYRAAAKDGDVNVAFLHELGHALFSSDMNGQLYMDNLKLFVQMRKDPMSLRSADPLASSMWEYHFQNAEENFVEMFANVLLTEANTALNPVQTSGVRAVISSIKDAIVHAAQTLDESKYYSRASTIINKLVEMDSKLARNNISVSSMVRALEVSKNLYEARGLDGANMNIRMVLKHAHPDLVDNSAIPSLTDGEAKLLFTTGDPLASIAFAISRKAGEPLIAAEGHATTAFTKFVDAYSMYRKAQEASACTRFVTAATNKRVMLDSSKMTPEQRAQFIRGILFGDVTEEQLQQRMIALPATYEDRNVAAGGLNTNQYELSYLYETGQHLADLLDALPTPAKRIAKALTREQKDALIDKIQSDRYMAQPLMELIRERFDRHGLGRLVDMLESGVRRDYLNAITSGDRVFSVKENKLVVESPKFKTWFGDSKVVDADNRPLVMYHGTPGGGYSQFKLGNDPVFGLFGPGHYFTADPKIASSYALKVRGHVEFASVYPVWLSIKNPMDMDASVNITTWKKLLENYDVTQTTNKALKRWVDGVSEDVNWLLKDTLKTVENNIIDFTTNEAVFKKVEDAIKEYVDNGDEIASLMFLDIFKRGGIDGLTHMGGGRVRANSTRHRVYIAFDSEQIKSVFNGGEFDPANPDIRRSLSRPDGMPDITQLFDVKDRDSTVQAITDFLADKASFKLFAEANDPKAILTEVFKVEESMAERLLKTAQANSKLTTQSARLGFALSQMKNSLLAKGSMMKLTADGWGMELPGKSSEVSVPSPKMATVIEATKGKLATPDSIMSSLAKLDKSISDPRERDAFGDLVVAFTNTESSEYKSLIAGIQEGMTEAQVTAYIKRSARNRFLKQAGRDSKKANSTTTKEGETREDGQRIVTSDRAKERDVNADVFALLLEWHLKIEKETGSGLFSEKDAKFLQTLNETRTVVNAEGKEEVAPLTQKEIADREGIAVSGVSMRTRRLLDSMMRKIGLSAEEVAAMRKNKKTGLTPEQVERFKVSVEKLQEQMSEPAKETTKPTPTTEQVERGAEEVLKEVAVEQKMEAEAPPVPVPTAEPSTGHATVETDSIKPEAAHTLVHTDKVADALVSGEPRMTKTAVTVTTNKVFTLPGKFTSAKQAFARLWKIMSDAYPDQIKEVKDRQQFVIDKLKEKGYDALMDEKGNVIPMEKPKVVGKRKVSVDTTLTPKAGEEVKQETTFTTEGKDVPVMDTKTVVEPVKGSTGVVETTTGDKPHVVQPLRRRSKPSEIAKLSPEEQLERKVNDDPKLLRENGMDRGFLRNFIKRYWSSKVEDAGETTLTTRFQKAWGDFVLVNSYIAEANRAVFGEDVMERFWAKVDEINANEVIRVKAAKDPKKTKPLSYREVLNKAGKAMRVDGKPEFVTPVLPEDLRFVREPGPIGSSELTVRLSSRNKRIQSILEAAEKDSAKLAPPPEPTVRTEGAPTSKPEAASTPEVTKEAEPTVPPDKSKVIGEWMENSSANTSRQHKITSFIGWLIAGDDGPRANWYRKLMNKTANWVSSSSQLQNTLCSSWNKVAAVARLFEDTLAQTGHIVSQGTSAFKTALQCKMEEDMLKTRLVQKFINFRQSLGSKVDMGVINDYLYETLFTGKDVHKDELVRRGVSPVAAENATKLGNEVLRFVRDEINADILNKELETGRMNTTDRHGNPADPRTYAPSQIDHERLATVPEHEIIQAMVRARIKSKLADKKLDRNTMVVLGWLNIKRDPKTGKVGLFSKDAEFWPAEQANMFSNETLEKLRVGADGKLLPIIDKSGISGEGGKVLRALKEANPDKYITLETDTQVIMYRVPESVDDLSPADRLRYEEAIKGNTGAYTEFWRKELGGKSLVQREMQELLAYMKKQYPYNVDTMGNNRPMFKVGEDSGRALGVSGMTPEEVFSEETLKGVWRTDLMEAYNYWVHGRYFDLNFQTELDRMFGHTGITIVDVLNHMYESVAADIRKLGKENGWTQKTIDNMLSDLDAGRKRLEFEFRDNADTLPFTPKTAKDMLGARTMSAAIKYTNSASWGIKHMADFIRELSKQFPHMVTLPNNIIEAIQHIIGGRRFSKSSYINSTVGDLTSALDHVQTELSNVYLGEQGNTPFGQDSVTRTATGNMKRRIVNARGARAKGVAVLEALGDVKQSIGSIGAVLNATRAMAKARLQRSIWHYVKTGALERLLDNLAKPENAELLKALNTEAVENFNKQHPLFKAFAKIARESGFGFDQHDALRFLKFNFRNKESIQALRWAMEKVGGPDGQVDIRHLYDVAAHAKRNNLTAVNHETLHRAISDYQMMLEDRIRSEAVNEPTGLSRVVNNDINTAGGRLWHALTSYYRSYQFNLRKNGAAANPWKYAIGTLFMGTVSNSIIAVLREWMAGREVSDIVKEMKDHPSEFFIKGIAHVPWFGVYNGILDAALAGVSYLNGGTYQFYGTPGMPVGIASGVNAMSGMYTDAKKLVSDPNPSHKVVSASKLLGFTDVINNTGVGIPVRMLEDMSAVERQSALGTYLQMIHKDPYPYSKEQTKGVGGYNPYMLEAPAPRNYTMEEHKYMQALQDRITKTPQLPQTVERPTPPKGRKSTTQWNKFDMSNSGVSSFLADLLEND